MHLRNQFWESRTRLNFKLNLQLLILLRASSSNCSTSQAWIPYWQVRCHKLRIWTHWQVSSIGERLLTHREGWLLLWPSLSLSAALVFEFLVEIQQHAFVVLSKGAWTFLKFPSLTFLRTHLLEVHRFKYQANTSSCNNQSSNPKTSILRFQNLPRMPLVRCLFDAN